MSPDDIELHPQLYTESIDKTQDRDRGGPLHGHLVHLLCNETTRIYIIASQDTGNQNTWSSISVLSASVGWMRDLTIAHQNLAMKLSEAFTIGSADIAIHSGSRPYSTIGLVTHLTKMALQDGSLISILSLVCSNLLSYSVVDMGAENPGLSSIRWMAVFKISTNRSLNLVCVNLG